MAGLHSKGEKMRGLRFLIITAAIAAVVALLIIGGCSQKTQQTQKTEMAQQAPQQPAATIPTPAQVQQPQPTLAIQQPLPQDDLYRDNQNQSLDELSQLE